MAGHPAGTSNAVIPIVIGGFAKLARWRPARARRHGVCNMTIPSSPKPTIRNHEFYLARMNACRVEASETLLPNVRDRALRAAAVWQEMYNKAQQFDEKRQGR